MSHRAPILPDFETPSEAECERGWKRWLLSHHLFVPMLALNGYCLERCAEAVAAERAQDEASRWLDHAARMRCGCGSLFLYGVDFEPCAAIYCGYIRSRMPPAFSGYQARERQNTFLPGLTAFRESLGRSGGGAAQARLRDQWVQADVHYHERHQCCMLRAVSLAQVPNAYAHDTGSGNPESLRAAYRRQHGVVPEIDIQAFNEFDDWFGIERRESLTWAEYGAEVARVVGEIVSDLEEGHRLQPNVISDLFDSMNAVLAILEERPGERHATGERNVGLLFA
ncbi:MAG TPA: hypothetical protein VHC90_22205 [Bryobacteraceae bacterium]|nr:hypothetical protein [Bryobacteraceae bacterium]